MSRFRKRKAQVDVSGGSRQRGTPVDKGWMRNLAGDADRFAVLDTETTGVYTSDRVIEIAIVTVGLDGQVLDQFDTLVQPGRDVTATHIHGITASMVADAPSWDEVAGDVAVRLHGACLVAHNVTFDRRMVAGEFTRVGSTLVADRAIDTLAATHGRLGVVCAERDITLDGAHRALSDARATAQLLLSAARECSAGGAAMVAAAQRSGRVLRREDTGQVVLPDQPLIAYLASRLDHRGVGDRVLAYLELVDRVIADMHLDADERVQLLALAGELGLAGNEVSQAHRRFCNDLIDAALDDHIVTPDEYEQLLRVAAMLDVDTNLVDDRTRTYRSTSTAPRLLAPGVEVVFTGDDPDRPRDELKAHAVFLCLSVHSGVRKQTGLLVAADPSSRSGKARKAADYNIPIVSTAEFADLAPGDAVAVHVAEDALANRKVITCSVCRVVWTVPATSSEHTSKPCAECAPTAARSQAPARPTREPGGTNAVASPAAAGVVVTETLICETCGRTWERPRTRGRKPKTCPTC